jgi:hypothetical protein
MKHVNYCNIFLYDAWNLHTYRFWAFSEKTPFLFSCFVKKEAPSMASLIKLYFLKFTSCLSTFSFWQSICRSFASYPIFVLLMRYDVWCNVMRNEMMTWCKMMVMPKTHTRAHTGIHKTLHPLRNVFWVSKLCIPLGTTFELLHLLFRWHLSSASP